MTDTNAIAEHMSGLDLTGDPNAGQPEHNRIMSVAEAVQKLRADLPIQERVDHVRKVRKLLSIERNPPIQQVVDLGAVPILRDLLAEYENQRGGLHDTLIFEATWALTNIASGSQEHCKALVDAGVVQRALSLFDRGSDEIVEQVVWMLGNVAGDSPQHRDHCLEAGAMDCVIKAVEDRMGGGKLTLFRNAAWALSNMCRGKNPRPQFDRVKLCLPLLVKMLQDIPDQEVRIDVCWALSYLSDDNSPDNHRIEALINANALRVVMNCIRSDAHTLVTPALRTMGNVVSGNDRQTQMAIGEGFVDAVGSVLLKLWGKDSLYKESLWALSNITAGVRQQIQAVLNSHDAMTGVIKSLTSAKSNIVKEAAWVVSNTFTGASAEQIDQMLSFKDMWDNLQSLMKKCAAKDFENQICSVVWQGLEAGLRSTQNSRHFNKVASLAAGLEIEGQLGKNIKNLMQDYNPNDFERPPAAAPEPEVVMDEDGDVEFIDTTEGTGVNTDTMDAP